MRHMNSTITPAAKFLPLVLFFGCVAACDVPHSDHLSDRISQEVGDLLNPDARRREAEVAAGATAAAEAATATALEANELAQANLKAAIEAKADAAKIETAKIEAERANAAEKAKEIELDKTKTRLTQATIVALKATEIELAKTKYELAKREEELEALLKMKPEDRKQYHQGLTDAPDQEAKPAPAPK
jgi:hypothetical protein